MERSFPSKQLDDIYQYNRAIRQYKERIDALDNEIMDNEDVHDQLLGEDCNTIDPNCSVCKQIKSIEERTNKLEDLRSELIGKVNGAGQKLEDTLNELFANEYMSVELFLT